MKKEDLFNKKALQTITSTFVLAALVITIINNSNLDSYIKLFIIPAIFLIISYIFLINKFSLPTNKKSYYFLIPIFLILLSYLIIEIDFSNIFLNIIIVPILSSIFFLKLVNPKYKLSRFLEHFSYLFPYKLLENIKYINIVFKGKNEEKNKNILNIFIGCVIGIPIALIILSLLSSADMYFNAFIGKMSNLLFSFINFNNIKVNVVVFVITFIIMFSPFINILHYRNSEIDDHKIKKLDVSIASTILWIINSVFVLFLISEISKITFNFLQLPIEYTYSEYAREGFFQLLGVTIINILIIIYFNYYTNTVKKNKNIKNLILVLILFSIILTFNSYYRMFLYIGAYKFTILRLQVILFLMMELISFLLIGKSIISKIKHDEAFIFMIIIISTYILNLYLCSEPVIKLINSII